MRHKNELPPNYQKLIDIAVMEIGLTFSDRQDNIAIISQGMGWNPRAVHSILGILTKNGVLRWSRKDRTWTVLQTDQRVA